MAPSLQALITLAAVCLLAPAVAPGAEASPVEVRRTPDGGLQPQVAVDADGVAHLVYLKGDPATCDVFYARSADAGGSWRDPVRVNSQPGSAIATGTVRGAHLALGKGGRVHVAWMGSKDAEPKAPGGATPMLYARLSDDGKSFESHRNVIAERVGLDGGGSVAADGEGNVYVAWHAPARKGGGEADRRVWVAHSADDGRTFAPEWQLSDQPTGVCGCCGMRAFVADGVLHAIYRSATEAVHRDIYLTRAVAHVNDAGVGPGATRSSEKVGPMESATCVMSTAAAAAGPRGPIVVAWERHGQIEFAMLDRKTGKAGEPTAVPGKAGGRKHPAVATNAKGETVVAWAEGTGWNKGGAVAWQVFDAARKPVGGPGGRKDGLPAWCLPAAFARADGSFVVVY